MIEAALLHGFTMVDDDGTKFHATQEQIVSLLQSHQPPEQRTLSALDINSWIIAEVTKTLDRLDSVPPADEREFFAVAMQEIAQGAALQVIMNKAALISNPATEVHEDNVRAGWWNDLKTGEDLHGKRKIGELLALVHSEISEAIEGGDSNGLALTLRHAETGLFHRFAWGTAWGPLFSRCRFNFHRADERCVDMKGGSPSALIANGAEDQDILAATPINGAFAPFRPNACVRGIVLDRTWNDPLSACSAGQSRGVPLETRAFADHPKARRNRYRRKKVRRMPQRRQF
ncbi:MAG: hypothetical protein P4M09_30925 [Devosia sp.]|nr:hypothetical protein [Devosia sp.]